MKLLVSSSSILLSLLCLCFAHVQCLRSSSIVIDRLHSYGAIAPTSAVAITTSAVLRPARSAFSRQSIMGRKPFELRSEAQVLERESEVLSQKESDLKAIDTQIKKVALPALAAAIIEPALTLIDMYFVGNYMAKSSATVGLAAMSVNGAIYNVIGAVFGPLCSGTTSVVSRTQGITDVVQGNSTEVKPDIRSGKRVKSIDDGARNTLGSDLINGVFMSSVIGVIACAVLFQVGDGVLRKAFGLTGYPLKLSDDYCKIRGLSLPFALINYVVTGFSVGVQDMTTPLYAIAVAAIVNIIGDYILVAVFGMGLAGAAWATTVATIAGTSVALLRLWFRYVGYRNDKMITWNFRMYNRLLSLSRMKDFFSTSLTLMVGYVVNSMTFSVGVKIAAAVTPNVNFLSKGQASRLAMAAAAPSMSTAAKQSISTLHIAAHQIATQLWWSLSYLTLPFSIAAQAIIPRDLAQGNLDRAGLAIGRIMKYAYVMSILCSFANIGVLKYLPNTFTTNADVQKLFQSVILQATLCEFFFGMTVVIDGIFIGSNRLIEYALAGVISTSAAWTYYFYSLGNGLGIIGAWNGLLMFCVTRFVFFMLKFDGWKKTAKKQFKFSAILAKYKKKNRDKRMNLQRKIYSNLDVLGIGNSTITNTITGSSMNSTIPAVIEDNNTTTALPTEEVQGSDNEKGKGNNTEPQ